MKCRNLLPTAYLAIAVLAWADFWRLPPDGLANLGLMVVVLPVTLLDLALRSADAPGTSVLIPDRFGYYGDHALYFGGSVLFIATLLWWLGRWWDARCAGARSGR